MSRNEFDFEEVDKSIQLQETKESYIENKAVIDFLVQHEPRKDIDLSKIKFPSYLNMNDGREEDNKKCKDMYLVY